MISTDALDALFLEARTHRKWKPEPVSDETLVQLYDLCKMGPTAINALPLRVHFVRSPEAKKKLEPCLAAGNVEKTMTAPVTAILAKDLEFYKHLAQLNPHFKGAQSFADDLASAEQTAHFNAVLQAGYFIMAARAAGLDCGPMAGFDNGKVDEVFFKGTSKRSILLINLGHGDASALFPRSPRPNFEEFCSIE